jgi:hypothetical protein
MVLGDEPVPEGPEVSTLEPDPGPVTTGREVEMMKEELAVGPTVVVELDRGNVQLVEEEMMLLVLLMLLVLVLLLEVVDVRPGQLLTVGLHWVTVTVLVMVWVEVVVVSTSWAATSERPVARTATMLLNCIVSSVFVVTRIEEFKYQKFFCEVAARNAKSGNGIGSKRSLRGRKIEGAGVRRTGVRAKSRRSIELI